MQDHKLFNIGEDKKNQKNQLFNYIKINLHANEYCVVIESEKDNVYSATLFYKKGDTKAQQCGLDLGTNIPVSFKVFQEILNHQLEDLINDSEEEEISLTEVSADTLYTRFSSASKNIHFPTIGVSAAQEQWPTVVKKEEDIPVSNTPSANSQNAVTQTTAISKHTAISDQKMFSLSDHPRLLNIKYSAELNSIELVFKNKIDAQVFYNQYLQLIMEKPSSNTIKLSTQQYQQLLGDNDAIKKLINMQPLLAQRYRLLTEGTFFSSTRELKNNKAQALEKIFDSINSATDEQTIKNILDHRQTTSSSNNIIDFAVIAQKRILPGKSRSFNAVVATKNRFFNEKSAKSVVIEKEKPKEHRGIPRNNNSSG